jgi:hypothetical protein
MLAAIGAISGAAATWVVLRSMPTPARAKQRGSPPSALLGLGPGGDAVPYTPPSWAPASLTAPPSRLALAHLPTPLHKWPVPKVATNQTEVWIKRDDMTGCAAPAHYRHLSGASSSQLIAPLAAALPLPTIATLAGVNSLETRFASWSFYWRTPRPRDATASSRWAGFSPTTAAPPPPPRDAWVSSLTSFSARRSAQTRTRAWLVTC